MKLENQISTLIRKLVKKKETVSFAESCTGGLISKSVTDISGASKVFSGSVVTYSNESKSKLLKIKPYTIKKHGAVSEVVARKMAASVRHLFMSTYGISVTGIAGPSGGTTQKPVGLVYIGFASAKLVFSIECFLKGSRTNIRTKTLKNALAVLSEQIT